ncbi:MAG: LPS biosynthesis protein WbpP [Planctomycetes bacterium]|nr:LPS biosynthesis protein WbpP [Planctomycetota bacterium]
MKCLVTGGAGFIGSNLVQALVGRGEDVTVLDSLATGHRSNLEEVADRITFIEGDLRDRDAVARAVAGTEVIWHQGAMPSVPRSIEDPVTSFEVNAGGTLNILMAARDAGTRRVVFAASSSAYGDTPTLPKHELMPPNPLSPYAADKIHGENLCRVFSASMGLECVGLRYFNVFGPRQRPDSAYAAVIPCFIHAVLNDERPIIYGDGTQSRDFTFIQNVIGANLLAADAPDAPGEVMNLGNGSRTSLLELLDMICAACGKTVEPVFEPPRAGDVKDSQADITRAQTLLGFEPTVDLAGGLGHTVEWFKNSGVFS